MTDNAQPTSITVSAPGSIMICGEHAVVYGYQALVCAIEQRIEVTLRVRDDRKVVIHSELANYQASLDDLQPHPKLTFVLKAIADANLSSGIELTIKSAINPTLGLGSSAAVTVATLGALALLKQPSFDYSHIHQQSLAIIHAIQGRGSGADLAASIYGGLIAYQCEPVSITPLGDSFPFKLALRYSGYKTPTAQVLAMIADKMRSAPDYYARLYQQMGKVTDHAVEALIAANYPQFFQSLSNYQHLLTELGVCDNTLSVMIDEAKREPQTLASKISGSGLGDCIVTLYRPEANRLHQHTPVTIAKQGLRLEHKSQPTAYAQTAVF